MSLAAEYKRQRAWRDWATIFDALPALQGANHRSRARVFCCVAVADAELTVDVQTG